jgi:hypothetical protein
MYRVPLRVESIRLVAHAAAGGPGYQSFTKVSPCFAVALNEKFHNRG